MNALTVFTSDISVQDGLYSLNDLHNASGGDRKFQPSNFMRLDMTTALIEEIRSSDLRIIPTKTITGKGKVQGTYVCKELVYAYAMWISPKFHLAVIRAFDSMQTTNPVDVSPHDRFLASFDADQKMHLKPIPAHAAVVDPSSLSDMRTLAAEYTSIACALEMMQIFVERFRDITAVYGKTPVSERSRIVSDNSPMDAGQKVLAKLLEAGAVGMTKRDLVRYCRVLKVLSADGQDEVIDQLKNNGQVVIYEPTGKQRGKRIVAANFVRPTLVYTAKN